MNFNNRPKLYQTIIHFNTLQKHENCALLISAYLATPLSLSQPQSCHEIHFNTESMRAANILTTIFTSEQIKI